MQYLEYTSFATGLLGAAVITAGVLRGLMQLLRTEWVALAGRNAEPERLDLRRNLGYYLLLGLEFLIAADIIDTLMRPELRELAALGAIVLIRTVISHSLNAELRSDLHPGSRTGRTM